MSARTSKPAVRVAMLKAETAWGDVKANLRLLERLAAPLEGKGVDVLITPECVLDGYMVRKPKECTRKRLSACCVSGWSDPAIRRVRKLAARLRCYVVVGASEKTSEGVIRNAAYLMDRHGEPVGVYYKTHPGVFYTPGDSLPVFQTDFGCLGIVICADRRWPENIRCLRLKGAEIILNPTWGFRGDLNTAIMRTRAYENGAPVCFAHPQEALICGADGNVAAVLRSGEPSVLVHDLDLGSNIRPRRTKHVAKGPPIQNRRPELYDEIVKR